MLIESKSLFFVRIPELFPISKVRNAEKIGWIRGMTDLTELHREGLSEKVAMTTVVSGTAAATNETVRFRNHEVGTIMAEE